MSREEADSVLQHRPNGTFLIRQSVNPAHRGEYTLSVKSVANSTNSCNMLTVIRL